MMYLRESLYHEDPSIMDTCCMHILFETLFSCVADRHHPRPLQF